jgi:hydroxyacylglutathione hydrolase
MRITTAAVPPFFKNGYVVACEHTHEAILIDPGDEVPQLLETVSRQALRVKYILLTHAHIDHITGVGAAKAALNIPVWLHRGDLFLYEGLLEQGRMFGIRTEPPPPVDAFFEAGQPLTFGRYVVDVLWTPGHCPGGVCLAIGPPGDAARELFVGDTLFAGSVGRTDLPGGDPDRLIRSIREVLFRFPDETVVHAGHGPDTTIGKERKDNPFCYTPQV